MKAIALLVELLREGVRLWVEGDRFALPSGQRSSRHGPARGALPARARLEVLSDEDAWRLLELRPPSSGAA